MAVYLFTYHAYRSWNADHPRGYVRRGTGILASDSKQAQRYDRLAKQPAMLFSTHQQQVALWIAGDACERRDWRLHQFASEPTHLHLLVSWQEYQPWQEVRDKLKNLMSHELGRDAATTGKRWFAKGASRKRVRDRRHFEHLMNVYLPRHRGLCWQEGYSLSWRPSASASGY